MALKKGSSIRLTWNRKRNHDGNGSDSKTVQENANDRYFVTESESEVNAPNFVFVRIARLNASLR